MGAAVLSVLLAGYGIAMPAGAISVFLIKLGATACLCIGAAAGLGAAWMAVGALRRHRSPAATPGVTLRLRTPLRAYAALAGVTVVYPLTVVYWVALVLGRQASAAAFTPAQAGLFVLAVFTASASWQFLLVSGGADRPGGRQLPRHAGHLAGISPADRLACGPDPQQLTAAARPGGRWTTSGPGPRFRPGHGAGEPISAPGLPRRNAHADAAGLARSAVAVTLRSRRLVR
jgi:hypothetical protein